MRNVPLFEPSRWTLEEHQSLFDREITGGGDVATAGASDGQAVVFEIGGDPPSINCSARHKGSRDEPRGAVEVNWRGSRRCRRGRRCGRGGGGRRRRPRRCRCHTRPCRDTQARCGRRDTESRRGCRCPRRREQRCRRPRRGRGGRRHSDERQELSATHPSLRHVVSRHGDWHNTATVLRERAKRVVPVEHRILTPVEQRTPFHELTPIRLRRGKQSQRQGDD